jgi:hypothetical protein
LQEQWDTAGGYVRTGWLDDGSSVRQTFSGGRELSEEQWGASGDYRRTTWNADGSSERDTFQNGREVMQEQWDGAGGYVRTGWLADGSSVRQTFSGGRELFEEAWDGARNYRRTTWNADGSSEADTFHNGREVLQEQWDGAGGYVRTGWLDNGSVVRQTFEGGVELQEDAWDNKGDYGRTTWNADGSSERDIFQNGKEVLQERWDGAGGYIRTGWLDNGCVVQQTFSDGTEVMEEGWNTSGGERRTTWNSDGSVVVDYFQDGSEVYRQSWDSDGNYSEYSWASVEQSMIDAVNHALNPIGFGLTSAQDVWNTITGGGDGGGGIRVGNFGSIDFSGITNAFSGIGDLGSITTGLENGFKDLGNLFDGLGGKINFGGDLANIKIPSFDDLAKSFDKGLADLGQGAADLGKVFSGIQSDLGDLGTKGIDLGKSILGGIDGFFSSLGSEATDLGKAFIGDVDHLLVEVNKGWNDFSHWWHDQNPFRDTASDSTILTRDLGYSDQQAEILERLILGDGQLPDQYLQAFKTHFQQDLAAALNRWAEQSGTREISDADMQALTDGALQQATQEWLNDYGFNANGTRQSGASGGTESAQTDNFLQGDDYAKGGVTTTAPDGTKTTSYPDGSSIVVSPNNGPITFNIPRPSSGPTNATDSGDPTGNGAGEAGNTGGQGSGAGTGNTSDGGGVTAIGAARIDQQRATDFRQKIHDEFGAKLGHVFSNLSQDVKDGLTSLEGKFNQQVGELNNLVNVISEKIKDAALDKLEETVIDGLAIPGLGAAVTTTRIIKDVIDSRGKDILDRVQNNGDPDAKSFDDLLGSRAGLGSPSADAFVLAQKGYTTFKTPEGEWVAVQGHLPNSGWIERYTPNPQDPNNPLRETNPNGQAVGTLSNEHLKESVMGHVKDFVKDIFVDYLKDKLGGGK